MTPMASLKVFLIVLSIIHISSAWDSFGERCEISSSGSDSCDPSKYLNCFNGRCQCSDTKNQAYTSVRFEVPSRSKRSPGKKGKKGGGGISGKTILAGAAGAAGGAYIGHKIAKAGSSSSRRKEYTKVYSCYSLVESPCVFDNTKYDTSMSTSTTTTTTTMAPMMNSTDMGFVSTSSTTPAPSPQVMLDRNKIPRCVEWAVCRPAANKFGDPRIGECQCESGYSKNSKDVCVKSSSGTRFDSSLTPLILSFVISSLLIN